jgi:hypothetical protein
LNATGTNASSSRFTRLPTGKTSPRAVESISTNVTFAKMRPRCDSSGVLQKNTRGNVGGEDLSGIYRKINSTKAVDLSIDVHSDRRVDCAKSWKPT